VRTDPARSRPIFVDDSGRRRVVVRCVSSCAAAGLLIASGLVLSSLAAPGASSDALMAVPLRPDAATTAPFRIDTAARLTGARERPGACERVEGRVILDADLNGVETPGERGIPDALVVVVDGDGTQVSTRTGPDGRYDVRVPRPGPVRVELRPRAGELIATPSGSELRPWVTFPTDGPLCLTDIGALWSRWFTPGDADGAVVREIGDRVWEDLDGDGVQDPGEPGIAGVRLRLLDRTGKVLAVTSTDEHGRYGFSGLSHRKAYAIALGGIDALDAPPLDRSRPTLAWAETAWRSGLPEPRPGATGRDSGHFLDPSDSPFLLVPPAEPGASDHSFDLGFRPLR
jgi:hypothetical protein